MYAILLLLFVFMPLLSIQFGFTWDEPYHIRYGERVWNYLNSLFFADRINTDYLKENTYLYGGLFDIICRAVCNLIPNQNIFITRHILNSLFGWGAIFFASLLAKRLFGAWTAILTILLILLCPRFFGHCMNNPKDIPFAAFFIMGIYALSRINTNWPFITGKTWLFIVLSASGALNVRAGGVILIAFLGAYLAVLTLKNRNSGQGLVRIGAKSFILFVITGLCILCLGCLFWPWAQQNPILRPFEALQQLSEIGADPLRHMLFNGKWQPIASFTRFYVLIWLGMGIPLAIVLGFCCSFALLGSKRFRYPVAGLLLVILIPVIWAVVTHTALYDGMRHFLFIVPLMATLAAATWIAAFQTARRQSKILIRRTASIGTAGALLALLGYPLWFSIVFHPYETTFFSIASGGIGAASGRFELDYWHNSFKECIDRIRKHALQQGVRLSFSTANGLEESPALYVKGMPEIEYIPRSSPRWTEANFILVLHRGEPALLNSILQQLNIIDGVRVQGVPLSYIARQ